MLMGCLMYVDNGFLFLGPGWESIARKKKKKIKRKVFTFLWLEIFFMNEKNRIGRKIEGIPIPSTPNFFSLSNRAG